MKIPNYYASRRDDIIEMVPKGMKHLLEVGCGMGLTGKAIKEGDYGCPEVIGVELETDIGEMAKKNIDRVIIGDIETLELPFENGYFDCIIYGDVLEHLKDPWGLLVKHSSLLKEGGYVIVSIPNVAHYRTIKMLLRKEWNYADMGIFDSTHLRFFGIKNIKKMLAAANLEIGKINRKISASKSKKFLNRVFSGALIDYMTEQYIILARKNNSSVH